jgi:RNA polymerase sigma-70 factor (ECF subfamily)
MENTTQLLGRLAAGDPSARNTLIARACDRLRRLTGRMLKNYPGVARWEQADDVLHNALIRLDRALRERVPEESRHFYNLAALQIRRELIDLARHYQGPNGPGTKHHTDPRGQAADDPGGALGWAADGREPGSPAEWRELYERVEALPRDEREVFDLLWTDGVTQEEAAEILGVSVRTVKRRWKDTRRLLSEILEGGR